MSTEKAHRMFPSVDYGALWRALRVQVSARQQEALTSCATERDHGNVMRSQGMMAAFGTVLNDIDTMDAEARGEEREG